MLHLDYSMNNEHAMIRLQATLAIAQHTGRAFAFSRGPDQRTRKCFPERESPPIMPLRSSDQHTCPTWLHKTAS